MRLISAGAITLMSLAACDAAKRSQAVGAPAPLSAENADSAFKAMDHRHGNVVGMDPLAMAHRFEPVANGGDIVLERDIHADLGITQIRSHLLLISRAFKRGNFTIPGFVHSQTVPGTTIMADKGDLITYTVEDLPHGGAIRIRTSDPEALKAIHSFIAFQIAEHRTK
ncbi:MAG TPA: hypothetical protein VM939_06540 [Gemmatimonadaceae bacterium]|nr:hypothetical protein [Gemmatimonadaceae bacterium]